MQLWSYRHNHLYHHYHHSNNHCHHNQVSFSGAMPDVISVVWNGAALCNGDSPPSGHNDNDDLNHYYDDLDQYDDYLYLFMMTRPWPAFGRRA